MLLFDYLAFALPGEEQARDPASVTGAPALSISMCRPQKLLLNVSRHLVRIPPMETYGEYAGTNFNSCLGLTSLEKLNLLRSVGLPERKSSG